MQQLADPRSPAGGGGPGGFRILGTIGQGVCFAISQLELHWGAPANKNGTSASDITASSSTSGNSQNVITTISSGQPPVRPVSGKITQAFAGTNSAFGSKLHNGVDYESALGNVINAVGAGKVHMYTKVDAGAFGSVSPAGKGSAIWVQHKLVNGDPIFVLYGHSASSWVDNTVATKDQFRFDCIYKLAIKSGDPVSTGKPIAKTAPFYYEGHSACHLHVGVFKPAMGYSNPPSSGWGYTSQGSSNGGYIEVPEGRFINPEVFFTSEDYRLATSI